MTPEALEEAARAERARRIIQARELWVCPDCGGETRLVRLADSVACDHGNHLVACDLVLVDPETGEELETFPAREETP